MAKARPFTLWIPENEMIESRYAPKNADGSMGSLPAREWVVSECVYINSGNPSRTVSVLKRQRAHGIEYALAR